MAFPFDDKRPDIEDHEILKYVGVTTASEFVPKNETSNPKNIANNLSPGPPKIE